MLAARSPGRLDVLGGDAAFAGALALGWPTAAETLVAVRRAPDRRLSLRSEGIGGENHEEDVAFDGDALPARDEADLVRFLQIDPKRAWTAFVVPALLRVARAANAPPGARVLIRSDLPRRAGLAASTALVVATLRAAAAAFGVPRTETALAAEAWELERLVRPEVPAAVPYALVQARRDHVLPILCQPAEPYDPIPLPAGIELLALDAPSRGSVDPDVRRRLRVAAGMAYRMMAGRMGLTIHTGELGEPQRVEDPYYGGYLCNVDPLTFAGEFRDHLPEERTGERFLQEYGGLADPLVRVDPALAYPVRAAARHVLAEHQHACAFVDALHRSPRPDPPVAQLLGARIDQSAQDARGFGLVARESERLQDELCRRGGERGILGVRASGGCGAVIVLLRPGEPADRAVAETIAAWEREFGRSAHVLRGSSEGAGSPAALLALDAGGRDG